jgi:hypothetical protein
MEPRLPQWKRGAVRVMRKLLLSLRIGFSVVFGAGSVLMAALAVRSFWYLDGVYCRYGSINSLKGHVICRLIDVPTNGPVQFFSQNLDEAREAGTLFVAPKYCFQLHSQPVGLEFVLPHWLLVLVSGSLAVAPLVYWRFSLRTLLIGTTIVAVVLGWLVHIARN